MSGARGLEIEQQAGALGAWIKGVDLARPLDDGTFAAIHDAFLRFHVIVIRDQRISPEDHRRFAERFGPIFTHPYVPSVEGQPGLMTIADPHPITTAWHQDSTHSKTPPRMSILVARKIPPFGGDTMFANQHLAFERLSPKLQEILIGLRAVHSGTELARQEKGLEQSQVTSVHPVARTHPETGRKGLFVNRGYVRHFEGMTEAESRPLLEFLCNEACRPEYTWRHRWREGDVLMWDNASVQHAVVGDVGKGERRLERLTIDGDVPY